jgi:4-hydroxy-tetrahydrodipicolinate reductase
MDTRIGLIGPNGKLGQAIAALTPVLPISRNTPRDQLPCDVLIDASSASSLLENLSANLPIVIGTTGHLDLSPIHAAAKHLPIFYAPNFSLGIALLHKVAAEIARRFPSDIDLIETHHTQKKDSPSGTALLLAQIAPHTRIHSIRSGKIIGEHTFLFNTAEERITLSHETHSRDAYARGAIAAAHFLVGKPPGLYTMDNLFA